MYTMKFKTIDHNSYVKKWVELRHMDIACAEDLPANGFITFDDADRPVCAGFLRLMEGNYATLDSLITNPDAAAVIRNEAVDATVECLMWYAKLVELKKIIATSEDNNTLVRSIRHGFVKLPHSLIVCNLT